MKNPGARFRPAAFGLRLAMLVVLLTSILFITVTAFMQGKGKQAINGIKQLPQAPLSTTEAFADPLLDPANKGKVEQLKEDAKDKSVKELLLPELPNLVTITSYPFSSAAGVALDDMSSGTTTLVAANLDDTPSAVTNLGFEFWYDGVRFTQFSVNANGLCRFGPTAVSIAFDNSTGFATIVNAPKVAPYFDDLWVGTNGKVHFKVTGSAPNRKLTVEWQNMQIPRVGTGNTGAGTFQMWLFETTGVIQFVYGSGVGLNATNGGYSIGLQSGAATNFASVTTTGNTVSYVAANNTQTNAITSGTSYIFTPQTASDPSGVNFTGTTATGTTVNWSDNSSNEVGFVVYRSLDNVNFSFLTQTAANATSFADSGLQPNTQYFYQVKAVTEGAVSGAASGNTTTSPAGNISSTAAGGNWSAPTTWVGGVVPTASDNVTIVDGATVTIDTAAVAFSVTVGTGGTPAVLQYEPTTARTLTVGSNVTVNSNGTFQSGATGTVTTHVLSLAGNLTNGGILDFSTNADTAGAAITFTGAASATFSGSGATTDIRALTINKGTSAASILELTATNFTVRGVTTDVAGFLTLTNGTFKISGTFTVTNRVFTTATYTIPATTGIWLNNPNFVVAGTASSTTTANNGLFRVSQGTYNIGVGIGDGMGGGTGAVFIIEGGTVNASGRIDPQSAVSYTQTGGTVNVATVGNNRSAFGSFEIFNTGSSFTMSGGTINVINRSTGATQVDYDVLATTTNVTGGLLVIGATGAPASTSYHVQGTTPNLTINPTMTLIVTTNASAGFPLFMRGTTVTNNGTITSGTGSPRFDFAAAAPMTYTGGIFGTAAAPFAGVGISANTTSLTTLNSPIICNRVNLFQGGFTNSNQITLGNGGTSTTVVQIGSTGLTTPGGSFDVSPNHMQGTGGQIVLYAFETTPRTTGVEINPTRTLTSINLVDNPNHVTIAGGDLTLASAAGALTLTNGRLITGANTLSLSSGTATVTRTNGYVDGNFRKAFAASASKVFEVGTANGFSPATINVTAGAPGDVTVKAVQAKQPNIPGTDALQRYWTLTAPAGITADLTLQYLPTDVVGTESNYLVYKYTGTFINPPGSSVNTALDRLLAPGQAAFSADWTGADPAALGATPGSLQFSSPTYSVAENVGGGVATITVTRTGGSQGPASINFATSNGSATGGANCTPGVDFVNNNGTLNWADADATSKTFDVTICNDSVFEADEAVNLALTGATGASAGSPANATLTITNDEPPTVPNAGDILISEFRYNGPNGSLDEFVEIYNDTDSAVVVADSGAGTGWALVTSDNTSTAKFVIPNGTTIPARGHFLATNSGGYSLTQYPSGNNGVTATTATGDITYTTDIPINTGLALFRTSVPASFVLAERLDAVGPASVANTLFKEGTGLPDIAAIATDYAWARRLPGGCTGTQPGFLNHNCTTTALISGTPAPISGNVQDADNNVADFIFVDVNGNATPVGNQRLGAPGPENLTSPIVRNSTIKSSLIDMAQPSSATPNRVRDLTPVTNGLFGTLDIRRKFTNNTGAPVTRLRFRIMDLSTFPPLDNTGTANDGADLRILTSTTTVVTITGGSMVSVTGTTLEEDTTGNPGQPVGGAYNSSLGAGTVTLGTPLAPGASINVRFVFGVQQTGTFRVFLNVEALP